MYFRANTRTNQHIGKTSEGLGLHRKDEFHSSHLHIVWLDGIAQVGPHNHQPTMPAQTKVILKVKKKKSSFILHICLKHNPSHRRKTVVNQLPQKQIKNALRHFWHFFHAENIALSHHLLFDRSLIFCSFCADKQWTLIVTQGKLDLHKEYKQ